MFCRGKLILFLVALLLAQPACALALGGLSVRSALNEPLDAQIELIAPNKGDLIGAEVELAGVEAHERHGIPANREALYDLQFQVVHDSSGRSYISVTTRRPIREPALSFVVEVRWPGGRLQRSYAVHLDPPR